MNGRDKRVSIFGTIFSLSHYPYRIIGNRPSIFVKITVYSKTAGDLLLYDNARPGRLRSCSCNIESYLSIIICHPTVFCMDGLYLNHSLQHLYCSFFELCLFLSTVRPRPFHNKKNIPRSSSLSLALTF